MISFPVQHTWVPEVLEEIPAAAASATLTSSQPQIPVVASTRCQLSAAVLGLLVSFPCLVVVEAVASLAPSLRKVSVTRPAAQLAHLEPWKLGEVSLWRLTGLQMVCSKVEIYTGGNMEDHLVVVLLFPPILSQAGAAEIRGVALSRHQIAVASPIVRPLTPWVLEILCTMKHQEEDTRAWRLDFQNSFSTPLSVAKSNDK